MDRKLCPALFLDEIGNDWDGDVFAAVGLDCVEDDDNQPYEWPDAANNGDKGQNGAHNRQEDAKHQRLHVVSFQEGAVLLIFHQQNDDGDQGGK